MLLRRWPFIIAKMILFHEKIWVPWTFSSFCFLKSIGPKMLAWFVNNLEAVFQVDSLPRLFKLYSTTDWRGWLQHTDSSQRLEGPTDRPWCWTWHTPIPKTSDQSIGTRGWLRCNTYLYGTDCCGTPEGNLIG